MIFPIEIDRAHKKFYDLTSYNVQTDSGPICFRSGFCCFKRKGERYENSEKNTLFSGSDHDDRSGQSNRIAVAGADHSGGSSSQAQ